MSAFKTKWFHRWANKENLTDQVLRQALDGLLGGLVDAELGGYLYKKRVALPGRGKRGGARTLIAFRKAHHAFFIYGFAKNERDNIDARELEALRRLAGELLGYSCRQLRQALEHGELIKVQDDGN